MKNLILLLITIYSVTTFAQKNEFLVSFDSGMFSYTGESVSDKSIIILSDLNDLNSGYTNNPFGSKKGLSLGLSMNFKRITKVNTIYSISLGYQSLKSKTEIESVFFGSLFLLPKNVEGETFLISNGFNFFPSVGKRFILKEIPIDLIGGLNFDFITSTKEKGKAKDSNGTEYLTSKNRDETKLDFGPRIQISTEYKKYGIYIGYNAGIVNYKSGYIGGTNSAYSQNIRFGLTYRIK